jgi:hypothetical protein
MSIGGIAGAGADDFVSAAGGAAAVQPVSARMLIAEINA